MMYVSFPLSLRNVEYLLFERGIDICLDMSLHWWNRIWIALRSPAHVRNNDAKTLIANG